MSPEEVYELANSVPGEEGGDPVAGGGSVEAPSHAAHASYQALVKRVTDVLLERVDLPDFEEWAAAYREDPDRFEDELLGFWKERMGQTGEDEDAVT
ncbi:MAG: hypothetical protein GWO44_07350 [Thermoplasmata archaeon]|nr:hypothetical protein [Thermoplasmata archaeon]NIY03092.1 hypothetical protein [Thermoplasmata archaeon]